MFKLAGKDTNTFESLLRAIIPLQVKTDFIVEVNRPYKSLEEAEAEARVCGSRMGWSSNTSTAAYTARRYRTYFDAYSSRSVARPPLRYCG